jgi:membrane dipeptidase
MKYLLLLPVILFLGCAQQTKDTETKVDLSTMDDVQLKAYAKEFAQKTIITDGHVDLPYRMKVAGFMLKKEIMDVSQLTEGNFDYPKSVEGGLDAPFMSIYIPSSYQITGGAKSLADSLINMVSQISATYPDKFAPATTPSDIEANFEAKKISLPMGMENGAPIESDIANVKYFYERGIRYITLTHGKDNQICDSSYDTTRTWNGLSPFGREVVQEMNRVGIMVDVSHISDSTFYQVMSITKVPAIASHSSARNFTPGFERNMSDDMIVKLAENGGVIQINFGSTFLSKESQEKFDAMRENVVNYLAENNLKRDDEAAKTYMEKYLNENDPFENVKMVANHIDHVVKLAGIDHVAFGSDYDGVGDTLPTGLKDVSEYPNLIFELFKRGYSEEDLEKICYKNVFRVWNKTAEYASSQN